MDLSAYIGKRFTLWLTEENDDSVVYGGWVATKDGDALVLERPGGRLEVETDWLDRIRPIEDEETRRILLNGDFFLRLNVGPNPEETNTDIQTGMRWPS